MPPAQRPGARGQRTCLGLFGWCAMEQVLKGFLVWPVNFAGLGASDAAPVARSGTGARSRRLGRGGAGHPESFTPSFFCEFCGSLTSA